MCLGVPYGTALWQVADSSQQNGKFKMLLNKNKRELFNKRMEIFQQDMHSMRTDIVPLVRKCWESSFGDVSANRRAIAERGWGPYNRALLLHPVIRASMTTSMIEEEKNSPIFPHKHCKHLSKVQFQDEGNGQVSVTNAAANDNGLSQINLKQPQSGSE